MFLNLRGPLKLAAAGAFREMPQRRMDLRVAIQWARCSAICDVHSDGLMGRRAKPGYQEDNGQVASSSHQVAPCGHSQSFWCLGERPVPPHGPLEKSVHWRYVPQVLPGLGNGDSFFSRARGGRGRLWRPGSLTEVRIASNQRHAEPACPPETPVGDTSPAYVDAYGSLALLSSISISISPS